MVMVLQKRVWRIMRENRGRYIGIVILILLGSFYFVAATGVSNNLEKLVVGFAEEQMNDMRSNSLSRDQVNITYPLASRLKLKEGIYEQF